MKVIYRHVQFPGTENSGCSRLQSSKSKLLFFCFEFLFSLIIKKIVERTKILFPGFSVNDNIMMTSLFWFLSNILLFFSQLSPSPNLAYSKPVGARKPVKPNSSCRALATCKLQTSFSPLVQTDNHVVQKFDARKIFKLSNEVIFFRPLFCLFLPFCF